MYVLWKCMICQTRQIILLHHTLLKTNSNLFNFRSVVTFDIFWSLSKVSFPNTNAIESTIRSSYVVFFDFRLDLVSAIFSVSAFFRPMCTYNMALMASIFLEVDLKISFTDVLKLLCMPLTWLPAMYLRVNVKRNLAHISDLEDRTFMALLVVPPNGRSFFSIE